ncbi:6562_t:CDS:1 [Racocetra fulgida]|uniref:6562_t:CDS:1 n=1 Tax=Racocetra fulgida TaxID=60492 RepID=A0A9N9HG50_9GLOM|nr:6562_t:CDS:1 [Racocetra fulgida]
MWHQLFNPGLQSNQPSIPMFQLNQPSIPMFQLNQPSNPMLQLNQPSIPILQLNQPSNLMLRLNQLSNPMLQLNQPSNPVLQLNQPSNPMLRLNQPTVNKQKNNPIQWLEDALRQGVVKRFSYHQFTFVKKLGSGGFGDVYQAKWNNQTIAIKMLKDFHNNGTLYNAYEDLVTEIKVDFFCDGFNFDVLKAKLFISILSFQQ